MSDILSFNNNWLQYGGKVVDWIDFNPLNLPPQTLRFRYKAGATPSSSSFPSGSTLTRVDSSQNVWDLYYPSSNWVEMFKNDRNLVEVLGANLVADAYGLFTACTSLTTVHIFDMSKLGTDLHNFFATCVALTTLPEVLNTSSCENFGNFLYGCWNLQRVPKIDTSSGISLGSMLAGCSRLKEVVLTDTSSAVTFSNMFNGCLELEKAPSMNLSSAQDISGMFGSTPSLKTIPQYDTHNVTNMSRLFYNNFPQYLSGLEHVPLLDTSNVINMERAFYNCTSVKDGSLDLYRQASSQTNPPSTYTECFTNCGSNTTTGAAELAQIPTSWGGTMA